MTLSLCIAQVLIVSQLTTQACRGVNLNLTPSTRLVLFVVGPILIHLEAVRMLVEVRHSLSSVPALPVSQLSRILHAAEIASNAITASNAPLRSLG